MFIMCDLISDFVKDASHQEEIQLVRSRLLTSIRRDLVFPRDPRSKTFRETTVCSDECEESYECFTLLKFCVVVWFLVRLFVHIRQLQATSHQIIRSLKVKSITG